MQGQQRTHITIGDDNVARRVEMATPTLLGALGGVLLGVGSARVPRKRNSATGGGGGREGRRERGREGTLLHVQCERGKGLYVWHRLRRWAVRTPRSLALCPPRRRASRNRRVGPEKRVCRGGAGAAAAWEGRQGHVWSAARRSLLPALWQGVRVVVVHASGWGRKRREWEGCKEGWAWREGGEGAGSTGQRAEVAVAEKAAWIRNSDWI